MEARDELLALISLDETAEENREPVYAINKLSWEYDDWLSGREGQVLVELKVKFYDTTFDGSRALAAVDKVLEKAREALTE